MECNVEKNELNREIKKQLIETDADFYVTYCVRC